MEPQCSAEPPIRLKREIVHWALEPRRNPQSPFLVTSPGGVRDEFWSLKDACTCAYRNSEKIPGLTTISHMGVTIERWSA
jgi:hypothetical protein